MSGIQFGTHGWRGVIAREFTFANVAIVTQAIAQYVRSQGRAGLGVIVGYDNRLASGLFAERAAEVLAGNDLRVLFCTAVSDAETVAAAIASERLAGGILVTSHHTPPEFHEIQFLPGSEGSAVSAGSATVEITLQIAQHVRNVETGTQQIRVTPYRKGVREGRILAYVCQPACDFLSDGRKREEVSF